MHSIGLLSLHNLSSTSFQASFKHLHHVIQLTVEKCFLSFWMQLTANASKYIYKPKSAEEINNIKSGFCEIAQFSGIVGCVDSSHSPTIVPKENEFEYVKRKNFDSVNVQTACDVNVVFQDIVAKWPGSHHDSFIMDMFVMHD